MKQDQMVAYLNMAVEESTIGMELGHGGPFGCVIVRHGEIIARSHNQVTSTNDPTAHAEMVAIRQACNHLQHFQLTDCYIFCSCEPCPMCFSAIYWARPAAVYFANSKLDAAAAGFDDDFIYQQLRLPEESRRISFQQIEVENALVPFKIWKQKDVKTLY